MSWFLAVLGFVVLIILHELGHFTAAKAVGMRVERFSLFFPPLLVRKKIGETEYAIGAIPAGGYVKITGMNPSEELSDEARTRAYYSQPVWKRIVVIAAGPAVNLVLGFVLLVVAAAAIGDHTATTKVASVEAGFPAQGQLHVGDKILAIGGRSGGVKALTTRVMADRCAVQPPTSSCKGTRPLPVTVLRDGRRVNLKLTPQYDPSTRRMRLGFGFDALGPRKPYPFGQSISLAGDKLWQITKGTVSIPAKIFNTRERKQIHGIVGTYETTRQTILHDPGDVVLILAVISLALGIVNLFPFLPLDGGHIFWALVELVRRRPVPFSVMERSGVVGFALVIMLFVIGLTNDIPGLQNGTFKVR